MNHDDDEEHKAWLTSDVRYPGWKSRIIEPPGSASLDEFRVIRALTNPMPGITPAAAYFSYLFAARLQTKAKQYGADENLRKRIHVDIEQRKPNDFGVSVTRYDKTSGDLITQSGTADSLEQAIDILNRHCFIRSENFIGYRQGMDKVQSIINRFRGTQKAGGKA